MAAPRRLVVGISGASGVQYGVRLLALLRDAGIETHLVMTHAAEVTLAHETAHKVADVRALATVAHAIGDLAAGISSGSFRTMGMVVAPCSIRSMSEIASGVTSSLLSRAADVTLKERRRLVLLVRETPLHAGHLRTMLQLAEMGAVIAPPVPAFYARPATLDDMIDHTLGRVMDLFDIETGTVRRWREPQRAARGRHEWITRLLTRRWRRSPLCAAGSITWPHADASRPCGRASPCGTRSPASPNASTAGRQRCSRAPTDTPSPSSPAWSAIAAGWPRRWGCRRPSCCNVSRTPQPIPCPAARSPTRPVQEVVHDAAGPRTPTTDPHA